MWFWLIAGAALGSFVTILVVGALDVASEKKRKREKEHEELFGWCRKRLDSHAVSICAFSDRLLALERAVFDKKGQRRASRP